MKIYKGLIDEVQSTSGKVTLTEIKEVKVIKLEELKEFIIRQRNAPKEYDEEIKDRDEWDNGYDASLEALADALDIDLPERIDLTNANTDGEKEDERTNN